MRIAAFNGFQFHDEMFGYIIHFCKENDHDLTIFCRTEEYNHYMEFYKKHFLDYKFNIIDCRLFTYYKYNYDCIFLVTDDDGNYALHDKYINRITIRIDHDYKIRNPSIDKYIAIRPFKENYRSWALPCYPILSTHDKQLRIKDNLHDHILIMGSNYGKYDENIINRIVSLKNSKIILTAIARNINKDCFEGIDKNRFELNIYENVTTEIMISIMAKSNYILTDISKQSKYETDMMAGAIPFSFSTLTPLIISKQSNKYYNFENVIEFDKSTNDDIILREINTNTLEDCRRMHIENFKNQIKNVIAKI
jgi:hypothetical protein